MPETKRGKAKEAAFKSLPLEEQVRRRAYELYVQRGNQSGSEFEDWLQAENEIRDNAEDEKATSVRR